MDWGWFFRFRSYPVTPVAPLRYENVCMTIWFQALPFNSTLFYHLAIATQKYSFSHECRQPAMPFQMRFHKMPVEIQIEFQA